MSSRFRIWLSAFTYELGWRMLSCFVLWPAVRAALHLAWSTPLMILAVTWLALWEFAGLFLIFARGLAPHCALYRGLQTAISLLKPKSLKYLGFLILLLPLLFAGTLPLLGQGIQSAFMGNAGRGLAALTLLYMLVAMLLAWPGLTFIPSVARFLKTGKIPDTSRQINPLAAFVIAFLLAAAQMAAGLLLRVGTESLYTAPASVTSLNWLLLPVLQILVTALPLTLCIGLLTSGTVGLSDRTQPTRSAAILAAGTSVILCISLAWPSRSLSDLDAGVKPVVVAHRGYAHGVTENTLESFRQASQAGARVAELDVYQNPEGELFVSHDQNLERVTGTNLDIEQASSEEIRSLKTRDGLAIPTLKQVLEYAKESGLHLVIEIKSTSKAVDTARKAAREIRDMGMGSQCAIAGFRHSVLAAARQVDPSISTELLLNFAISDVTSLEDVDIYSVQADAITPEMISQVHGRGKRIYAWTVNSPHQMDVLLGMGVDGLTTDDTPAAVQAIAEYEKRIGT